VGHVSADMAAGLGVSAGALLQFTATGCAVVPAAAAGGAEGGPAEAATLHGAAFVGGLPAGSKRVAADSWSGVLWEAQCAAGAQARFGDILAVAQRRLM
jgi:hypothetical protein